MSLAINANNIVQLREGLGFQFLSTTEQHAYKLILRDVSTMSSSINCPGVHHGVDLVKVILTVIGDNPTVFYFNKSQFFIERFASSDKRIVLDVVYTQSQLGKMITALNVTANLITSSIKSKLGDEYAKLIALYEYMQKNICYDENELNVGLEGFSNNHASHNAYGALMKNLAVCDGFATAFCLLAQKLGIECMQVIGTSTYCSTSLIPHAWNIVKIKTKFYHVDVTWDAKVFSTFGEHSYDYFLLNDEEIQGDHAWCRNSYPSCMNGDLSYHLKNGLYVNDIKQFMNISKSYNTERNNVLRVKFSKRVSLPKDAGEFLVQKLTSRISFLGMRRQLIYSWNENTRSLFVKFA